MRDNMVGQGYNPTDAQINQQLNILKEKCTKGFANPKASTLQRRRANFAIQAKKWAKKRKKK